jgi:RNA polymerase sigma-70 factor (ECF subfamily)
MLEDRRLLWQLRRSDADALQRIYDKYKHDMLGLAVALAGDRTIGEDVVHDVFVSFARACLKLRLRTSLRSYLLCGVANRVRSLHRAKIHHAAQAETPVGNVWHADTPHRLAIHAEQAALIEQAIAQLPDDQREVILLHLQVGMKFREIAQAQNVSINTVQSHYRYGLQKLRSLLDGKVTP